MYNVGQVLSPGFGRSWHEVVAIVQEAAHQLQPGFSLPAAEDIHLDELGTLTFGFGDESSGNAVAALAGLLDSLLNGVEAPASLRDLVRENTGPTPAHATVTSFSQALAFFERPNRVNDIRAVAGRLRGFREQGSTELEFQRLREKVAKSAEPEQEKKQEPAPKRQPKLSKRQQAAVVALVALSLFGTLGFRAGLHRSVGLIAGTIEGGVQDVVSAGLEQLGVSKAPSSDATSGDPDGSAAKPPARTPEPVEAERVTKTASRPGARPTPPARRPSAARALDAADTPRSTTGSGAASRASVPQPVSDHRPDRGVPAGSPMAPPPAAVAAGTTPPALITLPPPPAARPSLAAAPRPVTPGADAVFSSENPEVQAPVLIRPQLPRKPAPGDDTGIFEMIVDENGDVTLVNLISPRRNFHDRMLVAAAKAWKFRPATLDGQPVKYRIRIPIILPTMPGRS